MPVRAAIRIMAARRRQRQLFGLLSIRYACSSRKCVFFRDANLVHAYFLHAYFQHHWPHLGRTP